MPQLSASIPGIFGHSPPGGGCAWLTVAVAAYGPFIFSSHWNSNWGERKFIMFSSVRLIGSVITGGIMLAKAVKNLLKDSLFLLYLFIFLLQGCAFAPRSHK